MKYIRKIKLHKCKYKTYNKNCNFCKILATISVILVSKYGKTMK